MCELTLCYSYYEVNKMAIGENIRFYRQKLGVSQKELGEKLGGISQQQIGQWENNVKNPKVETQIKIAAALGVPV